MPRSTQQWGGAAALWVTAAGWAGAARRHFGAAAPIVTPTAILDEGQCLAATGKAAVPTGRPHQRTGRELRQLAKDSRAALQQERYRRSIAVPADWAAPMFIWQHHELFHRAGGELARRHDVPLLEYVHAPVVWEARRWGVRRAVSGRMIQRLGEVPQLKQADLVGCVSEEVAAAVVALGVDPAKTIIAPMAVDPERFCPFDHPRLSEQFTVGWVGSFRKFHALELLLEAGALLRHAGLDLRLVLVGDGFERKRLQQQSAALGLADRVEFRGQIANPDLPQVLSEFDAAVLTATANQDFHYSPLKLREYMAMGLPVVAPRLGDIARMITDGTNGALYEAGDARGLADALAELANIPGRREELGAAARERVLEIGTWDVVLTAALERLGLA